MLRLKLRVKN